MIVRLLITLALLIFFYLRRTGMFFGEVCDKSSIKEKEKDTNLHSSDIYTYALMIVILLFLRKFKCFLFDTYIYRFLSIDINSINLINDLKILYIITTYFIVK